MSERPTGHHKNITYQDRNDTCRSSRALRSALRTRHVSACAHVAPGPAPGGAFAGASPQHIAAHSRFVVPDTLDAWIEQEMERRRIPGLSLAIARAGEILTHRHLVLHVTTRHLLNHTSGLPGMGEVFTGRTIPYPLDVSEQDSYAAARGDTLLSRPGEKYVYSDVGYFLLGVITGHRIYRNEARGYTIRDGEWVNIRRVHKVETPSHHGTFSNVLDLVKWDEALYGDSRAPSASTRSSRSWPMQGPSRRSTSG
jgi:hypothetical protein